MMWPLCDETTPVIIQGMTGKEGMRMADWMIRSGVNVVAGVTPGKGGQTILERPIYDRVADACAAHPGVLVSCAIVPAPHVASAVREAMSNSIGFVYLLSEGVPVHDVLALREEASQKGICLLGPSSVGMLQFPRFRIGYLGGERPFEQVCEGDLALLSASGGMANELLMALSRAQVGIRLAVSVGGDRIPGTTLEEAMRMSEAMESVKRMGLFVEAGNPLLQELAEGRVSFSKPTILFTTGDALEFLPRGIPYGHAGTIVGEGGLSLAEIREKIRARGIECVESVADFVFACQFFENI